MSRKQLAQKVVQTRERAIAHCEELISELRDYRDACEEERENIEFWELIEPELSLEPSAARKNGEAAATA